MNGRIASVALAAITVLLAGCAANRSNQAANCPRPGGGACANCPDVCPGPGPAAGKRAANCPNQCCPISAPAAGTAAPVSAASAEALRAALQDERTTRAFYVSVMAKHGQVRPFSNIANAEAKHEQMVTALMKRHGVEAGDSTATVPEVPATLAECNRIAAQLERENIALYDRLLKDVTEPDIRAAFTNLRKASVQNHLPAFERWSAG